MVKIRQKGDFTKTLKYFNKIKKPIDYSKIEAYCKDGIVALSSATPVDSGRTSKMWNYKIKTYKNKIDISFYNENIQNGVPIAIILQYGHATRNGGWVEGIDYVNPAIKPIFEKIANSIWKEVITP